MMEPLDSPDRGGAASPPLQSPPVPQTIVEPPGVAPAKTAVVAERDMLFFRRPDLNARQLFFQRDGSEPRRGRADSSSDANSGVPVQLIGVDGRSQIGVPASATAVRRFNEVAVTSQDARRATSDGRLSRVR
jgi:hypothetical protein